MGGDIKVKNSNEKEKQTPEADITPAQIKEEPKGLTPKSKAEQQSEGLWSRRDNISLQKFGHIMGKFSGR